MKNEQAGGGGSETVKAGGSAWRHQRKAKIDIGNGESENGDVGKHGIARSRAHRACEYGANMA